MCPGRGMSACVGWCVCVRRRGGGARAGRGKWWGTALSARVLKRNVHTQLGSSAVYCPPPALPLLSMCRKRLRAPT